MILFNDTILKKIVFKQGTGNVICCLSLFFTYANNNDIDEPKWYQAEFQEHWFSYLGSENTLLMELFGCMQGRRQNKHFKTPFHRNFALRYC